MPAAVSAQNFDVLAGSVIWTARYGVDLVRSMPFYCVDIGRRLK